MYKNSAMAIGFEKWKDWLDSEEGQGCFHSLSKI
jgi:hypothetical protein